MECKAQRPKLDARRAIVGGKILVEGDVNPCPTAVGPGNAVSFLLGSLLRSGCPRIFWHFKYSG